MRVKGQAASQVALLVIDEDGPNLLDDTGCKFICFDWPNILRLQGIESLRTVLHQHQVIKEGLGTMKGGTAKLYVDSSVPFAMRQKLEKELLRGSKHLLLSSQCLAHYDMQKDLVLACNTSAYYRHGTVSSPRGWLRETLSRAEKKYSQLEKEGWTCVFGVKCFHSYLCGRPFTLCTDHKPLLSLLSEQRIMPPPASARIQRWALRVLVHNLGEFLIKLQEARQNHQDEVTPNPK